MSSLTPEGKYEGRTLTGAWIETRDTTDYILQEDVAPSRVRGLKQVPAEAPSGIYGRTLTGAWIETVSPFARKEPRPVAPSRVRGLKPSGAGWIGPPAASHPHGCVD